MALARAIDYPAIHNALVLWVRTATSLPTLWANQDRTQVAKPYAVLEKIAGPIKVGNDERRRRMQGGQLYTDLVGARELTYNLQFFTATDKPGTSSLQSADDYATTAQAALDLESVVNAFVAAGISIVNVSSVTNPDATEGARSNGRASLDLTINAVSNLVPAADQPTNWIETAEATGNAGAIDTREG